MNDKGERIHRFDPFLADVEAVDVETDEDKPAQERRPRDPSGLDTIVVPALKDGSEKVFLGQDRYKVRIHPAMIPQLRYVAVYRTAPVSAITHYAPIRSIEPWENSGKMVINFAEPARELGPLKLTRSGRVKHLQGLRYTTFKKLKNATSLDEAF